MTPPSTGTAETAADEFFPDLPAAGAPLARAGAAGPVVDLGQIRPYEPDLYVRVVKPFVDRLGGLLLLIALMPVMLVSAVAVSISMGRPVLLRQRRIGFQGEIFTIYKFRTMRPSRRQQGLDYVGPERRLTHKHPEDPRMTRCGRFLRTWSLDELPQLLNVVRGDMSLVGPRPEMVEIVERYEPWQHRRHQVRPGVTGLWQVSARGDAPMHELTQIDLDYLERVSLWTDVKILLLTLPAAMGMRRGF